MRRYIKNETKFSEKLSLILPLMLGKIRSDSSFELTDEVFYDIKNNPFFFFKLLSFYLNCSLFISTTGLKKALSLWTKLTNCKSTVF